MSEFPKFTNNPKGGPDEPKSSTTELNAKQNIQDYDLICPICQETLPKSDEQFCRYWCCGNGAHYSCMEQVMQSNLQINKDCCVLCRTPTPKDAIDSYGRVVPSPKAMEQLQIWVGKNKAWALHNLAFLYEKGFGIEQSYEKCVVLYEKAIAGGHAGSASNLGTMYMGLKPGVTKDIVRGLSLLKMAAEWGEPNACMCLAQYYFQIAEKAKRSLEQAKLYAEKALAEGNVNMAAMALGMINNEINNAAPGTLCSECGKLGKVNYCKGCRTTYYCSKVCQVKNWKQGGHKKVCKKMSTKRKGMQ